MAETAPIGRFSSRSFCHEVSEEVDSGTEEVSGSERVGTEVTVEDGFDSVEDVGNEDAESPLLQEQNKSSSTRIRERTERKGTRWLMTLPPEFQVVVGIGYAGSIRRRINPSVGFVGWIYPNSIIII